MGRDVRRRSDRRRQAFRNRPGEPPRRPGGEILLASSERRSPRVPVTSLALADAEGEEQRPIVDRRKQDEDLEEEDDDDEEEDDEEEEEADDETDIESDDFAAAPFDDDADDDGDVTDEDDDAEAYDEEEEYPVSAFQHEEEHGPENIPVIPAPARAAAREAGELGCFASQSPLTIAANGD